MVIHIYIDKQTQMDGPGQGQERWEWRWGNVGEGLQEVAVIDEVGRRSRVRAFRFSENGRQGLDKPRQPNITRGGRDSGRLNLEIVSPQFHRSLKCIESHDINVYLSCTALASFELGST